MTRVVRTAALLCAGILVASAAMASVPDPAHSTLSNVASGKAFLSVEGQTSSAPDNCSDGRCANFLVTVHDAANNPIAGSTVVFDASNTAVAGGCPDIQLSCDQSVSGTTGQTYLGGKKVSGTTNASGQFTFKIQGASNAVLVAGNVTSSGTNVGVTCATIYADGVALTPNVVVSAYDVNGTGSPGSAVSGADAAIVAAEAVKVALGAQARARDDINFSGTVTGADAAVYASMAVQTALGTGSKQTAPFCP